MPKRVAAALFSRRILAAVAIVCCAAAVAHASGNDVLLLKPGVDPGSINASVRWLHDLEGTLSLDEVRAIPLGFHANDDDFFNPGVSNAVIWVRVDVENVGHGDGNWIVSLNRFLLDVCEVYFVSSGHAEVLLQNTPESFQESYERFQTLAAQFDLPQGESGQIFIRYRGANWSGLQLSMHSRRAFEGSRLAELAVFCVLLGGVGTLVLYGSVSFAFMGTQIILLYAAAQIALFVFYAHMTGFTTVYLWPGNPQAGRVVAPIALMSFVVAMAQFARRFLETSRRTPLVDRLLFILIVVGLLAIVTSPLDYIVTGFDRRVPVRIIYAVTVLTWIIMPLVALHAVWRWHRDYWPLAVAWTFMAIFMINMQLVWLGVVSTMPFGKHTYGAVVFTEAFFVALAIAFRIRILKIEALTAQERLGESLHAQLEQSQRATRFAEEREWALQDLAEKGRLLLAAGHDTRQMLSALRSYAVGLRMGADEAEVEQVSHDIEQISSSLNEVLTSAVEGSRSGGIADHALALDTVTVSSILAPLELIHGRSASEAGLELRIHKSEQLLATDRVLMVRVLGNLLTNAIKYTAAGKILVGYRPCAGGHRFQVWDTGSGIAEGPLARLLEPGTGALRLQDGVEGVGAGLGISHALAERLGGYIAGRSVPGKGSVFELILPCSRVDREEGAVPEREVILLDTDPEQILQIRRLGEELGVRVELGASTEQAPSLLAAESSDPQLILIDQHFSSAEDWLEAARDMASAVGVPTAVMTYDRSAEARARLARVSDLILYRPVSAMALEAALDRL